MTSLSNQLKKLKLPQTDDYRVTRSVSSFLYDQKQAAGIDCATHLDIAKNALEVLIKLNPQLEEFREVFSDSSIDIDRAVLDEEDNQQLSETLRKLINNTIVPFFTLNDCHEVLEYLIYKYKIHTYQPNDLLCALLPYHETKLFVRAIQLFQEFNPELWAWLDPFKKENIPVPKERIHSVLAKRSKASLVSLLGKKLIEINQDTLQANVYTSFYTTVMMCLMDYNLDESFLASIMPYIYKAVKSSSNSNLYMSGLVLIGYLSYTQPLDETYVTKLVKRLEKTRIKILAKNLDNKEFVDGYFMKVINLISRTDSESDQLRT